MPMPIPMPMMGVPVGAGMNFDAMMDSMMGMDAPAIILKDNNVKTIDGPNVTHIKNSGNEKADETKQSKKIVATKDGNSSTQVSSD